LSERLVQQVKMQLDERPMSLKELSARIRVEQKQVYRVISSLHRSSHIVHFRDLDGVRRYKLSEESLSRMLE
jgi:predicted transcriptional regulator